MLILNVKADQSGSAAKEPIPFDIIVVCRKQPLAHTNPKRERGDSPTRQPGAPHTNPKHEF